MKLTRFDSNALDILKDLSASNRAISEAVALVLGGPVLCIGDEAPQHLVLNDNTVVLVVPPEDGS